MLLREHFDLEAPEQEREYYKGYLKLAIFRHEIKSFARWLGIEEGQKLLDVGCGIGLHLVEFVRYGAESVGCDFSSGMLTQAKKLITRRELKDKINLVLADARFLPFKNRAFDRIYSYAMLQHIPLEKNRERVLSEIQRVLKITGRVGMDVGNGSNKISMLIGMIKRMLKREKKSYWFYSNNYGWVYIKNPTIHELMQLFREAGLKVVTIRGRRLAFPAFVKRVFRPIALGVNSIIDATPFAKILLYVTSDIWVTAEQLYAKSR
jgi:ubiquinone/menaquinone biosynthesis C-methylase UbiE